MSTQALEAFAFPVLEGEPDARLAPPRAGAAATHARAEAAAAEATARA